MGTLQRESLSQTVSNRHWYFARLCWNSEGWVIPTGEATQREGPTPPTFVSENGFGFEEWLFSHARLLDGLRYGFVQGVYSSYKDKQGLDLSLLLFTIKSPGQRYFVGHMDAHVLDATEAANAYTEFSCNGTIAQMIQDATPYFTHPGAVNHITAPGGGPPGGQYPGPQAVFIIRYHPNALHRYSVPVPSSSRVWALIRYKLYPADKQEIAGLTTVITNLIP
jgi:hypothetical protein